MEWTTPAARTGGDAPDRSGHGTGGDRTRPPGPQHPPDCRDGRPGRRCWSPVAPRAVSAASPVRPRHRHDPLGGPAASGTAVPHNLRFHADCPNMGTNGSGGGLGSNGSSAPAATPAT